MSMLNTNFNLSYILTHYLPHLNQYTPEELIPLQTSIFHNYLKTPTQQKYFFSTISNSTNPNILYLFPPQYLLFYILHSHHLQDIFINHIISSKKLNQYLYKEIPLQRIPTQSDEFFHPDLDTPTPLKDFFNNTLLAYSPLFTLNKKVKNILKAVFIIKQFYSYTSQPSLSPEECSKNILLSMLFSLNDCALAQSFKTNNKENKTISAPSSNILNFIKDKKLVPQKDFLQSANTYTHSASLNLLKALSYKHLYFYTHFQDEYYVKSIQSIEEHQDGFDTYIYEKFKMTPDEYLKNYKMFLLDPNLYFNYAVEEDICNSKTI